MYFLVRSKSVCVCVCVCMHPLWLQKCCSTSLPVFLIYLEVQIVCACPPCDCRTSKCAFEAIKKNVCVHMAQIIMHSCVGRSWSGFLKKPFSPKPSGSTHLGSEPISVVPHVRACVLHEIKLHVTHVQNMCIIISQTWQTHLISHIVNPTAISQDRSALANNARKQQQTLAAHPHVQTHMQPYTIVCCV